MRIPLVTAFLVGLVACGGGGGGGPDGGGAVDAATAPDAYVPDNIDDFLATVPGLTFEERQTDYPGYRLFVLYYVQPVDHNDPNGRTFVQRIILHHIDRAAPMILYTSGYYLFGLDYLSELGTAMSANQVSTEQRFFGQSVPDGLTADDWQYVTIAQAAADHHRIVQALAPYYNGIWLSTGHSKGGMTSIYHRRFYPDDVDATVAYVAPISFGAPDARYEGFFDTVGTQTCRDALTAIQREALTRFSTLLPMAQAEAQQNGLTFDRAGGQAAAFEGDIAGMNWSFWQYYGQCDSIPATTATDQQLYDFVSTVGGIGIDDDSIGRLQTYYYQAEEQLGYPAVPTTGVDDLLQYQDVTGDYLPAGTSPTYDDATAMDDIDQWVKNDAERIMFVYGGADPWYAGAFDPGNAADTHLYVVPGGNHGSLIADLPAADKTDALDVIERWTGVRPSLPTFFGSWRVRPPMIRVRPPR